MDNGDIENYAESSSSCTNYCIIYYRISSFAGLDYDSFRCLYDLQSIEGGISLPILLELQDQVLDNTEKNNQDIYIYYKNRATAEEWGGGEEITYT